MLTCCSRKSAAVTYNINQWLHDSVTGSNTRTLKLKQLNGIQPSVIFLLQHVKLSTMITYIHIFNIPYLHLNDCFTIVQEREHEKKITERCSIWNDMKQRSDIHHNHKSSQLEPENVCQFILINELINDNQYINWCFQPGFIVGGPPAHLVCDYLIKHKTTHNINWNVEDLIIRCWMVFSGTYYQTELKLLKLPQTNCQTGNVVLSGPLGSLG